MKTDLIISLTSDFGRIEVAKNQGRFADDYELKINETVIISFPI